MKRPQVLAKYVGRNAGMWRVVVYDDANEPVYLAFGKDPAVLYAEADKHLPAPRP